MRSGVGRVSLALAPSLAHDVFDLVGDNWRDGPEKPLAVFWDFNPWKRNFVSRYFPQYRAAFVSRGRPWRTVRTMLEQLDLAGARFVLWGAVEREDVIAYASAKGIPVVRVEDGFIRSSDLGGRHTTALSLAIDDQGIYFDARSPSRLEMLLNETDFNAIPELIEESRALLKIIRDLNVSKYNLASIQAADAVLGPHIRRRVLVLGQVEADASIRCGLAAGWTDLRLIRLAMDENPHAEILYKPHPDVLNGLRKNSHAMDEYTAHCRVLEGDLILGALFEHVDHVYTLTSLSGFEALIHGVKVTTVGAPFYSGWGLTDDRTQVERRKRRLAIEEVFCAAYLLYPKYLVSLDDPVRGCLATIIRILAERGEATDALVSEVAESAELFDSHLWPATLRSDTLAISLRDERNDAILTQGIGRILEVDQGHHFQLFTSYLLCGKLRDTPSYARLLDELRIGLPRAVFERLVCDLWACYPSRHLLRLWASLCEQSGDVDTARRALAYLSDGSLTAQAGMPRAASLSGNRSDRLRLAQFELRNRRTDVALDMYLRLLLSGDLQAEVFEGVAEIALLRKDFSAAASLLKALNVYEPGWRDGHGHVLEAQALALVGRPSGVMAAMASACSVDSCHVESWPSYAGSIPGPLPYDDALRIAVQFDAADSLVGRARGLVEAGRLDEAEALLLTSEPAAGEFAEYAVQLSEVFRARGKLKDARRVIASAVSRYPKAAVYREAIRVAHACNTREWADSLMHAAIEQGLDLDKARYFGGVLAASGIVMPITPASDREFPEFHACAAE